MQILHIDIERTWRGGENQLRLLLEGLTRTDVECHLATPPDSIAATRLSRVAQILALPMQGGFNPRAALALTRYCRTHRIDLIDAHTSNAHSLGLMVKALVPELRLVVHRRVDFPPSPSWISRRKYLSAKVDRYVAISQAIGDILVAHGVPTARVSIVKSAIKSEGYDDGARPAARAALAAAHRVDSSLAFIGNASALTAQKGYETLLDAAALLQQRGAPFHLFIAGDGALRQALHQRCNALGLTAKTTFLGFIDDVPGFLAGLDILAVPSNFEGLGTILLDGLAAGLAVAATRVGGIPEVIIDGETGLLSPVADAVGHAANLQRLIEQPLLRQQLNAAGRRRIAAEFSLAAMIGGNLDVYRELIGPRSGGINRSRP